MGKYLVTGRSGSGKSEVCRELQKRGFNAFDGDKVEGLAGWRDPATSLPVDVDYSKPIDPSQTAWSWDAETLSNLLDTESDIFLCGSADNQLTFHWLFDKVFILTLSPKTQKERIAKRTEHDYGKSPEMQERIIDEQAAFTTAARKLGALSVDAEPDVQQIVDLVLELI